MVWNDLFHSLELHICDFPMDSSCLWFSLVRVLIMLASVCAALGLAISLSSETNEMIKIMQSQNDKSINFTFFFYSDSNCCKL
jgi:hypothetical protein